MLVIWVLFILLVSAAEGNNSTCEKDEFSCFDGSCIHKDKWCDNELHCVDGTDENYCSLSSSFSTDPNNCSETRFFRCNYGPCIPLKGRCDGHFACIDRSDEHGCDYSTTGQTIHGSSMKYETYTSTEHQITPYPITDPGLEGVSTTTRRDASLSNPINKDLERDFVDLDISHFRVARINAQHWIISVRNQNGGWNEETARAITALHLSEDGLQTIYEETLMRKELHLMILVALLRNESSPVSLEDLSLYMNALLASCENPKDFYGLDLVYDLRQRTDLLQSYSNSSNPLIYLTLCLNDATTKTDLLKIKEIAHSEMNEDRLGVLALASLAATCISKTQKFSSSLIGKQVAEHLYSNLIKQGLPDNVYELALVTQALNEARINQDLWNRSEALRLIINKQDLKGSFGNILSTYLAIPVLSGRSLLSVKDCGNKMSAMTAGAGIMGGEDKMKYTLFFGNPVSSSISMFVPVKKTTSFFDVMRKAAAMNPSYEFRYSLRAGKPIVYSIGGIANDPEHGMYWDLYIADSHNSSLKQSFRKYKDDTRSFFPAVGEEVIYWRKSIYW